MLVIRMAQESITPLVELPVKVLVGFEHSKNKSGPEPKHLKTVAHQQDCSKSTLERQPVRRRCPPKREWAATSPEFSRSNPTINNAYE